MSMYKFVKGSRLFMQSTRNNSDYDNVADSFHPTNPSSKESSSGLRNLKLSDRDKISSCAHPEIDAGWRQHRVRMSLENSAQGRGSNPLDANCL